VKILSASATNELNAACNFPWIPPVAAENPDDAVILIHPAPGRTVVRARAIDALMVGIVKSAR
jgi:hypothetical protein